MDERVLPPEKLEEVLGYSFDNPVILLEALTHPTYANENPAEGKNNERLEFLGDAVVGLIAARELFARYPKDAEGAMTQRRARVVSRPGLAALARKLELSKYVLLGHGEARSGAAQTDKVLSNTFEALTGALLVDGGMAAVEACITEVIIHALVEAPAEDYKTPLQELCHREKLDSPVYSIVDISGPDHSLDYACEIHLGEKLMGQSMAKSKKRAEQQCAKQALEKLNHDDDK